MRSTEVSSSRYLRSCEKALTLLSTVYVGETANVRNRGHAGNAVEQILWETNILIDYVKYAWENGHINGVFNSVVALFACQRI